jgi:hypothetical protein
MWLIYAPGAGIYFDTGVTISFAEHQDAYTHFNVPSGSNMNEAMSKAAAAAGYDSVQFLAHVDHVNYQCDTYNTKRPGFDYSAPNNSNSAAASGRFPRTDDAHDIHRRTRRRHSMRASRMWQWVSRLWLSS